MQHREVMGYESAQFLSYFKPCIDIMSGGIESGFRKVQKPADYRSRLLRIVQRGKKVMNSPCLRIALFSLDAGQHNQSLSHLSSCEHSQGR